MGWLGAWVSVCVGKVPRARLFLKTMRPFLGRAGVSPSAPMGFFDPRIEGGERRRIVGIFAPGPTGAKTTQQR